MLNTYILRTRNLLQLPNVGSTLLYSDASLITWINQARGQIAGEGECLRYHGAIATVAGQRQYNFVDLDFGVSATTGIAGAIHVRTILYDVGAGQQWVAPRAWEWFQLYALNNIVPTSGPPVEWAQYGQGTTGNFSLDPIPDDVYTLSCGAVCYPIDLVLDATVEAIPYLWTDAVPYFAAYLALMSAQASARIAEAERMFNQYNTFMERARTFSNPSVLRWQYSQANDPTQAAKIGIQAGAQR